MTEAAPTENDARAKTKRTRFGLRGLLLSFFLVCLLLVAVFRGVPALIDYLGKATVAIHQRDVTRSLNEWGAEYSQISSERDAGRAREMMDYIKTYYVPSDGYRADPATEAALEAQRKRTIDQITSSLNEWNARSQR